MEIKRFALNELGTNTYVVAADDGHAIVIDPSVAEMAPVIAYTTAQGLHVTAIVNTHCHFDHVLGNETLRAHYGVPLWLHRAELPNLRNVPDRVEAWFGYRVETREPDGFLQEGDVVTVGNLQFRVIETPGHSPGGICLYEETQGVLLSGDTLFAGTVGRTDLPGSDPQALFDSLRIKLWPLPDSTKIYPGHEEDSTIGEERMHNPYFHFPE